MGTEASAAGRRIPLLPIALLRPASDGRLVEQVRGGSEAAFEVLFDRYHPQVLAFCRRMLRCADEAEDAAQQTFVAAYRQLAHSDAEIQLRPWLYTVARHRCLNAIAARRAQPLADGPELAVDRLVGDITIREELRGVLADVARLPDDQRAAIVLALLGGLPHAEIADSLGCSPGKVKALVFQARESLTAGRTARDTACADVRLQIEAARGTALRRAVLRRHLSQCVDCRAFRDAVRIERRAPRLLLPLAPLAALKRGWLALLGPSGTGGAGVVATALVTATVPIVVATSVEPPRAPERARDMPARTAAASPVAAHVRATRTPPRRPAAIVAPPARTPTRRAPAPSASTGAERSPAVPTSTEPPPVHTPSPAPHPKPSSAPPQPATPKSPAPSADRPKPPKPAPPGQTRPRPAPPAHAHGTPLHGPPPTLPAAAPARGNGHGPPPAPPGGPPAGSPELPSAAGPGRGPSGR